MKLKTKTDLSTLIGQLTQRTPALMSEANVPGLSIALIRDARVVWAEGFGVTDTGTRKPVTPETMFEACSLSKAAFAYAALKLHEQGIVDLDTSLGTYLPATGIADDPRIPLITMRTALCHTCGLPNWRGAGEPLQIRLTPGERFSYSGEGYMVLQRVIEHITGQGGETFMQTRLLKPLSMNKSSYHWTGDEIWPLASGHNRAGKPVPKGLHRTMSAAYSLHTTPTEFAQLITAVMQPQADNESHLSRAMLDIMLTPHVQVNDSAPWHDDWPKAQITLDPQVAWGLGWGLQQNTPAPSFWHWGDNFTYTAFAIGFREEGVGIVIMTNSGGGYDLFAPICHEAIGGDYPGLRWLRSLFR